MDLRQAFIKHLEIRDISYDDKDNLLLFSYEGWRFALMYDEAEPYYFRLAIPRVASINQSTDSALLRNALSLSRDYKVAKAVISQDEIWLFFETFLFDYDFKNTKLFDKAILILAHFANDLHQKIPQKTNSETSSST